MTWKDSNDGSQMDAHPEEAFLEEDYSPMAGKPRKGPGGLFQWPQWPFGWIVAGVLALIALYAVFFAGRGPGVDPRQVEVLAARLTQLENRLNQEQAAAADSQRQGQPDEKLKTLSDRLNRFEEKVTQRMDELTGSLETLAKKTAVAKNAGSDQSKPVARKIEPQYHLVSKGETLYSISRAYGMTVLELLSLNNLKANAAIYPGQKLKIK